MRIEIPRLSQIGFTLSLVVLSFHFGFIWGGELIAAGQQTFPPVTLPSLFVSGTHTATVEYVTVWKATEKLAYLILSITLLGSVWSMKQRQSDTSSQNTKEMS
jgi:hypothetical protein